MSIYHRPRIRRRERRDDSPIIASTRWGRNRIKATLAMNRFYRAIPAPKWLSDRHWARLNRL